MDISSLLEQAAKTCSPPNYAALADALGVQKSAVSNWRSGRALPDEVSCAKLADMLDLPLARVLGMVGEARAISRDAKAVWRRLGAAAAVACIAVALPPEAMGEAYAATLTMALPMHYANLAILALALTLAMFRSGHDEAPMLA